MVENINEDYRYTNLVSQFFANWRYIETIVLVKTINF